MFVYSGMGQEDTPIFVEPGLFEWLAWYPDSMPDWMSVEELTAAGYNIQLDYQPFVKLEELQDKRESVEQFYMRSNFLTHSVLRATKTLGWISTVSECHLVSVQASDSISFMCH